MERKLQTVELPFGAYRVIIATFNGTHVVKLETEVQEGERRDNIALSNRLIY